MGRSGCGKSTAVRAIMGISAENAEVEYENLSLDGEIPVPGHNIAMIFQDSQNCLNPSVKIGKQIAETVKNRRKCTKKEAKKRALELLDLVGIRNPALRMKQYPFELSGGMRQRVVIAIALACDPRLIIADEPTTALDVTIQAQIMELIRQMNREMGTAVLLISHDLGVIRQMCTRVYIMYAGRVVESGETKEVLAHPLHPYTKGLIASIPSLEKRGQRLSSIPGTVPALEDRSEHGCPFYNRCSKRREICEKETPPMVVHKGHMALCVDAKEELGL